MGRRILWVTQEKTGKNVSIPIADSLYTMFKKSEKWKEDEWVLPKTAARYAMNAKDGTNIGMNIVNKQRLSVIQHVGLGPSVRVPGRTQKMAIYGAHSFRHGFVSHCAENNISRAVCASILGADSSIIDAYYVHIGEDAQRKTVDSLNTALKRHTRLKTVSSKCLEVPFNYIAALPHKSDEICAIEKILQQE